MTKENFTAEQLTIYNQVKSVEDRLMKVMDTSTFIYNPEVAKLLDELNTIQFNCKHHYEDGFCAICGRPEDDQTVYDALSEMQRS